LNAPVQRVVHGCENLINGDMAVVVPISGLAVEEWGVAESDVHHREDLIAGAGPSRPQLLTQAETRTTGTLCW
jgi:hypothetical protein